MSENSNSNSNPSESSSTSSSGLLGSLKSLASNVLSFADSDVEKQSHLNDPIDLSKAEKAEKDTANPTSTAEQLKDAALSKLDELTEHIPDVERTDKVTIAADEGTEVKKAQYNNNADSEQKGSKSGKSGLNKKSMKESKQIVKEPEDLDETNPKNEVNDEENSENAGILGKIVNTASSTANLIADKVVGHETAENLKAKLGLAGSGEDVSEKEDLKAKAKETGKKAKNKAKNKAKSAESRETEQSDQERSSMLSNLTGAASALVKQGKSLLEAGKSTLGLGGDAKTAAKDQDLHESQELKLGTTVDGVPLFSERVIETLEKFEKPEKPKKVLSPAQKRRMLKKKAQRAKMERMDAHEEKTAGKSRSRRGSAEMKRAERDEKSAVTAH